MVQIISKKHSRGSKAGPLSSLGQIKGIYAQYIDEKNKVGVEQMKKKLIGMQRELNNRGSKAR